MKEEVPHNFTSEVCITSHRHQIFFREGYHCFVQILLLPSQFFSKFYDRHVVVFHYLQSYSSCCHFNVLIHYIMKCPREQSILYVCRFAFHQLADSFFSLISSPKRWVCLSNPSKSSCFNHAQLCIINVNTL
jgi:hypothetical protein